MVRRHANFVNFFDAGLRVSRFQFKAGIRCLEGKVRTFELPADFDHVWVWHARGKVETDKFDNQPLHGQQALSILFEDLGTVNPSADGSSTRRSREKGVSPLTHHRIHVNLADDRL